MLTVNTLSFVFVLALSLVPLLLPDQKSSPKPQSLFQGLSIAAIAPKYDLTIVVGANVCLDVIARAKDVVFHPDDKSVSLAESISLNLDVDYSKYKPYEDYVLLENYEDFYSSFMKSFEEGAANERQMNDIATFSLLEKRIATAPEPSQNVPGGNAYLMAHQLASFPNVRVSLAGSSAFASYLPTNGEMVAPTPLSQQAPPDLDLEYVDRHLILEYSRGEVIGITTAPRANRYIVTSFEGDRAAERFLELLRRSVKQAEQQSTDSLVLSGFHVLEPLSRQKRYVFLNSIAQILVERRRKYSIHLELASSGDTFFVQQLAAILFPLVDSLGLNEVENSFLHYSFENGRLNRTELATLDAQNPRVVAESLRFLMRGFPSLTRIHFHSLSFHMIARAGRTHPKIGTFRHWGKSARSAVAAGSVAATAKACSISVEKAVELTTGSHIHNFEWAPWTKPRKTEDFAFFSRERLKSTLDSFITTFHGLVGLSESRNEEEARLTDFVSFSPDVINIADPEDSTDIIIKVKEKNPVVEWTWSLNAEKELNVEFYFAPVVACRNPKSTVGLGDVISATGLAVDIRTRSQAKREVRGEPGSARFEWGYA